MTRARRLLLSLLLPLLVVPVVVTASAGPAHACSCAMAGPRTHAGWADAVFVGEIGAGTTSPSRPGGAATVAVSVQRVYQGRVADEVVVDIGGPCGFGTLPAGRSWLFYTSAVRGSAHSTSICSGTTSARPRVVAAVERVLGAGRPVTSPTPNPMDPPTTPDPTDQPTRPAQPDPPASSARAQDGDALAWSVGLGALVLVVGAVVVVVRARRAG